ncbi:MAG TPA: histidine kinase [Cyclobacteriaceae bacterium]|nr:histidine kinase [Cyclobacteriaceae bacterium]
MKNQRIVIAHTVAWAIYVFLYSTLWRDGGTTLGEAVVVQLWTLPPKLFLVYTALLILIPRFFLKGRYLAFFLALVAASLLGGLFNQLIVHFVFTPDEPFWDISRMSKRLTYINSTLLFALAAEGIRMWYQQRETNERLIKEKMITELSLLRSQLQPHFFFNTMNNLYSLVLQKSDLAAPLVLQMSDMMRYIISSSKLDRIALADEINFIKDYIGIESVRYSGKVRVDIEWPANVDGFEIPPLTLFPFVENAFKHGVADETGSAWISVKLSIDDHAISYIVRNSYPANRRSNGARIGLQNTKDRLRIAYSADAILETRSMDHVFEATLVIKTSKK